MRAPLALAVMLVSPAAFAEDVVAVFDLDTRGVEITKSTGRALSEYAATQLAADDRYAIVPKSEIRRALRGEKAASYAQCYDEACQIEIGKEIAANLALSMTLSRIGKSCVTSMRLYDLRTASTLRAAAERGPCHDDAWVFAVERCVAHLLGKKVRDDVVPVSRTMTLPAAPRPPPARSIDAMSLDTYALIAPGYVSDEDNRTAARLLRRHAKRADDPGSYHRLGKLYRMSAATEDRAVEAFETVLERWPDHDLAEHSAFELGRLYLLRGELVRARARLSEAAYPRAALLLGELNRLEGRWTAAERHYRAARDVSQDRHPADYRLAWLAFRDRRDREALRRIDAVIANSYGALVEAARADRAYFRRSF